MKKYILNPKSMFVIGLALGVLSRLLDIHTQNLGNIFSRMPIWIFFGVIISIYSDTKKKAMLNIFPFCIGMLITYYYVAHVTNGVYSEVYIVGWTAFALASPPLAYFTWMAKGTGILPKIISTCLIAVSALSSIVFFDRLRIDDYIIIVILVYYLFVKKSRDKIRRYWK